jgi:hypothetical protein
MLRGNAIFPYPEISFEIGEHPADFRPGNSKGDKKSVCFLEKSVAKIFQIFKPKSPKRGRISCTDG